MRRYLPLVLLGLHLYVSASVGATPSASISITIEQPGYNEVIDNSVYVHVWVTSTYEIAAAEAIIGDHTTELTYDPYGFFSATLDLTGVPSGDHTLTITVSDVLGNAESVFRPVVLDRRPTVSISLPLDWSVTTDGMIEVAATCNDHEGACTLEAAGTGGGLIEGQGAVSGTLTLVVEDGRRAAVGFTAVDERGQASWDRSRSVFVETNPAWELGQSVEGYILDVDDEHILYGLDYDRIWDDGWQRAAIVDRTSGLTESIPLPEGRTVAASTGSGNRSFLTTTGAIFVSEKRNGATLSERVYDWNQGTLFDLGYLSSTYSLRASEAYATWQVHTSLVWRDLRQQQSENIAAPTSSNNGFDVAEDGRVVYTSSARLSYLYEHPNSTLFADGFAHLARYEGESIYFMDGRDYPSYTIKEFDGGTYSTLIENVGVGSFEVNEGWIAFHRPGGTGQTHVWLAGPDGQETQLTFFSGSAEIEALSPTGEVIYLYDRRRYWADSSGASIDISSDQGEVRWMDGGWHLLLGRSILGFDRAVTSTEGTPGSMPAQPHLSLPVPNPVHTTTRLSISLPQAQPVSLVLYDVLGRRVATLADGRRASGTHNLIWDATHVPSGSYVAVLTTPSARSVVRLTVVH